MRQASARTVLSSCVCAASFALAALSLLGACVSTPDPQNWIRVGVTTRDEVVTRYGQPHVVIASPGGDTVVYRPTASRPSAPRVEIPTAQAAPSGKTMTHMQTIDPGLRARDLNRETEVRLLGELRIRFDAQGVVQELSPP